MNKDILNKTINDFKIKKTSIIVSTTVIEVELISQQPL